MTKNFNQTSDVLVIGAGIAGIVTAIDLLDQGDKKIILLDRDTPDHLGGLAKESFGGIFVVDSPEQRRAKIKDTPELAFQDWCNAAHFTKSDQLPKSWAEKFVGESRVGIYDWLKARGVSFFPVVHWVERGMSGNGNSVPRFHIVWGTGKGLIDALVAVLQSHPKRANLEIRFGHHVKEIMMENGRATGCEGVDPEQRSFQVKAEVTVVSAGGFCGNLDFVRKNWHPDFGDEAPETLLNGAHQYGDGTLHLGVQKVGGVLTAMNRQWNYAAGVHHPRPKKPLHGLSLVPPRSALWMNWKGERIGPTPLVTGFDTRFLVEEICKQDKKYSWQILNRKTALKELAVSGSEYNDAFREKSWPKLIKTLLFGNTSLVNDLTKNCSDFVVANTLEELVVKMNQLQGDHSVDFATMKNAIDHYDTMIDRGSKYYNDEQLWKIMAARTYKGDRVRTCRFQKILEPSAGPLIAIREFILARKSMGGVRTDLHSRVLNQSDEAIRGLYSVGETAGFGGGNLHGVGCLEGTFLGGCIITAHAATNAIRKGI